MIRNLINNRVYIGVHRTNCLDDGYMGSGTLLKKAIAKHGIENFEKRILKYYNSEEDMFKGEAELVTKDFIKDPNNYNITEGGNGFCSSSSKRANERRKWFFENDPEWRRMYSEKLSESIPAPSAEHQQKVAEINRRNQSGAFFNPEMRAEMNRRSRSPEAIKKRKETYQRIKFQQGKNNSSYGTHWITDGIKDRKLGKEEELPAGWFFGKASSLKRKKDIQEKAMQKNKEKEENFIRWSQLKKSNNWTVAQLWRHIAAAEGYNKGYHTLQRNIAKYN